MSIVNALIGTNSGVNINSNNNFYSTPGTFTWVAPANVYSVSVLCVGAGGGGSFGVTAGGGGGLGWKNNISVVPGQSYTVVVGAGGIGGQAGTGSTNLLDGVRGGNSYFISTSTVAGFGGLGGISALRRNLSIFSSTGGSFVGDGGGNGGDGGTDDGVGSPAFSGGGGGAGGYTGNGGRGGDTHSNVNIPYLTPLFGEGGGGGGGGGGYNKVFDPGGMSIVSGSGGGVGTGGIGTSGASGNNMIDIGIAPFGATTIPTGGSGGSSGTNGANGTQGFTVIGGGRTAGNGGLFGGGGAALGGRNDIEGPFIAGSGANGAVRIIWGPGRSYPYNAS